MPCPDCGKDVSRRAPTCPNCGTVIMAGRASGATKEICASNPPKDPLTMALLSACCIAGLGQILLGQVTKGVAMLLGSIVLAVATAGISALITWPLMGIDAYMVASRLKEGCVLGEWDFFPSA